MKHRSSITFWEWVLDNLRIWARVVTFLLAILLFKMLCEVAANGADKPMRRVATYNGTTNAIVTILPTPLSDFPPLPPGFNANVVAAAIVPIVVTNITIDAVKTNGYWRYDTNGVPITEAMIVYDVRLVNGTRIEMSEDGGRTWGEGCPDRYIYSSQIVGYDFRTNAAMLFRSVP
jgi:hypothetical protein